MRVRGFLCGVIEAIAGAVPAVKPQIAFFEQLGPPGYALYFDVIREAHRRGQSCVRVVHGKGHGSPGRPPVLKSKVQRWLAQRGEGIAFAQASAAHGGAGELLGLLAPRGGKA